MGGSEQAALRARLKRDDQAELSSLRTATDHTLSIGADVWRLRWRGQATTAVAEDTELHTTCGALLDALAMFEDAPAGTYDPKQINVLIDRDLPGRKPSETAQALRTLRSAVSGMACGIWYRGDGRPWQEDTGDPPEWPSGNAKARGWLTTYLLPRLHATPGPLAAALVAAVSDLSLHLYPSEITATVPDRWALRLDGLEVGTVGPSRGVLTVGKPGKTGMVSSQRKAFTEVFGAVEVAVSVEPQPGELGVEDAARDLKALLRRLRVADISGLPVTHRVKAGTPIIDEHTFEARLLKGVIPLREDGNPASHLVLGDTDVARGSQFPTQWGHGGGARYLDALLRDGSTPLAIELKVATGGQGRYYRRSLIQAVLYAHFIRSAPDLEPWFETLGLDRTAAKGAIGIPVPERWTPRFGRDLVLLRRVAARVEAEVFVFDPRTMPGWNDTETFPEPPPDEVLYLSWRLAGALAARWPAHLGLAVEWHTADFYDELYLHNQRDRGLGWPAPTVRVSMNRPGSLRIWSPTRAERWVWGGIWNRLHAMKDVAAAAETIGAIAGLPAPTPTAQCSFPQLAAVFLDTVSQPHRWDWRSVWTGGVEPSPFARIVSRYRADAPIDQLPTLARLWVAAECGEARVLVDQQNLRVWVAEGGTVVEMPEVEPLARIVAAASLVGLVEG